MIKYIGQVNIPNIRDFILGNSLEEGTVLALHPHTCDELAVDYRKHFSDKFSVPLSYLGVTITSDNSGKTPKDRVRIAEGIEKGSQWVRIIDIPSKSPAAIYRCGWCGGLVDKDSKPIDSATYHSMRKELEDGYDKATLLNGECCRNEWPRE